MRSRSVVQKDIGISLFPQFTERKQKHLLCNRQMNYKHVSYEEPGLFEISTNIQRTRSEDTF